jgi:hypothetical protein
LIDDADKEYDEDEEYANIPEYQNRPREPNAVIDEEDEEANENTMSDSIES